jgi:hypothetical protein
MNVARKRCCANRAPEFDATAATSGAAGALRRSYVAVCFAIQSEIAANACGAKVSSIARDSAGKPM